jgi:trehalose utilization protein
MQVSLESLMATPLWQWFSDFLGGIRFKNYIAKTASATVYVEDKKHPVMKGVNPHFLIPNDEFYTFDKSPREKNTCIGAC